MNKLYQRYLNDAANTYIFLDLKIIRFCMLSLFGRVICCKDISCFETCVILRNITCLNMFIVALNIITDSYHRLINALDEFYCSPILILIICMSHYNSFDKGMFVLLQWWHILIHLAVLWSSIFQRDHKSIWLAHRIGVGLINCIVVFVLGTSWNSGIACNEDS